MNKRIISLVLALVMVLGTFTSVFAAEETKKAEVKEETKAEKVEKVVGKDNKIQYIIDKKFVEGYEDGSMGYDKNIKRSEITKLLVFANGNKELAERLQGTMKLYSDVDTAHWANGVINVGSTVKSDANGIEMLNGYPDGSFKPDNDVTYAELAKMLVVLAKEDLTADMAKNAKWAADWMTWAAQLGILDDVTVADSNKAATRADAFTMVYNALYAMKEFKAVPANEVRGILSDLDNNKLVLNQDDKKEYTITKDTVFVDGDNKRSNSVLVNAMNNKDFYLGSLVRVLLNDKDEVTHILVLGNPVDMAKGLKPGQYGKNDTWKGVADNTASTFYNKKIESLKGLNTAEKNLKSYVTIQPKANKAGVESITFNYTNKDKANLKLEVNDDTKVYVANPHNNIMREVKDIDEAITLIGYKNFKEYKIPNVYAGYDDSNVDRLYGQKNETKNYAKVVVFNVVAKEESDLYRVIETTRTNHKATVENTDGEKFDKDSSRFENIFPHNAFDGLYDVVEVFGYGRNAKIDTKIDHSETKDYPIVEVIDVDDDYITVADEYEMEKDGKGHTIKLDIRDADIFTAKDKLEKGSVVQFRLEDNDKSENVVDILSILPKDTELEGSLADFGDAIQTGDKVIDRIVELSEEDSRLVVYYWRNSQDKDEKSIFGSFKITKESYNLLKEAQVLGIKIEGEDNGLVFNIEHDDDVKRAINFRLNDGKTFLKDAIQDKKEANEEARLEGLTIEDLTKLTAGDNS
jgi:hypothetical protein